LLKLGAPEASLPPLEAAVLPMDEPGIKEGAAAVGAFCNIEGLSMDLIPC
jgi:hypothetical protein